MHPELMMNGLQKFGLLAGGALLLLFASACSSSSGGGGTVGPAVSSIRQNRTVDSSGQTVDVLFNKDVDQVQAEMIGQYTISSGNITSATLQPDNRTVRLVLDAVAVPGTTTFGVLAGTAATGNVDLSGQVTDGDTVTISDGTDAVTFEFNMMGAAAMGNVEVDKGADATEAIAALLAAINAQSFNVTASAGAGDSVDLVNDNLGAAGNVVITDTEGGAVITPTGLAGGGGIEDTMGVAIPNALTNLAVTSTDITRPTVSSLSGVAVAGANNDEVQVTFDDDMVEADVEDPANWAVQAPIGTVFDVTGATVNYDAMSRTATLSANAAAPGVATSNRNNFQTFDTIRVAFTGVRDIAGNSVILPATGTVGGDDEPPFLASVSAAGATTADYVFSEAIQPIAFTDLYSGGIDPGPRFILTDADGGPAVGATGSVTITGDPADGDTVAIGDGVTTVTFEWDMAGGGVGGGNTAVAITSGNDNVMAASLSAAITASALTITPASAANVVNLTNDTAGVAGNVATVIVGNANVTATGMSNGAADSIIDVNPVAGGFAFDADQNKVTIDYAPATPVVGTDTVLFYGVRDLAGNTTFAETGRAVIASSAAEPSIDAGASAMTVFPNRNNDIIVVGFMQDMSPSFLLDPSNYSAAPLDLSNALLTRVASDEVFITLNGEDNQNIQFGQNYTLTLVANPATPLRTAQGVALTVDDTQVLAGSGDSSSITAGATSAYVGDAGNPNTAVVLFPEAVDLTAALDPTNYTIAAVAATAVSQLNARAFRVTFAAQPVAAQNIVIAAAAATDVGGNPPIGALSIALGAVDGAGLNAPAVLPEANAGVGGDQITVTFDEPVDLAAALDAANYDFVIDSAPFDDSTAEYNYNSDSNAVLIRLPQDVDLRFTDVVETTISNVTDLSGNALLAQPVNVNVLGDSDAPGLSGARVAFANLNADATGRTYDVSFDEACAEGPIENLANWGSSGAAVVSAVERVTPRIARVTFNAVLADGDMIEVTNLRDLAGNVELATLSVEPIQ